MKKLLRIADRYLAESDWKTMAALKFCLFSMGLLAGMRVAEKRKRCVGWIAAAVFTLTYFPLVGKLFRVMDEMEKDETAKPDESAGQDVTAEPMEQDDLAEPEGGG